jgi:hypothetical protein
VAPRSGNSARVSSNPPGRHAGNLDNKELVAGTTLYVPVFVPGALFEVVTVTRLKEMARSIRQRIETSLRGRFSDGAQE